MDSIDSGLHLRFLGPFSMSRADGRSVELSPTTGSVVAYMTYNRGRALARESLQEVFWGHIEPHRGRRCLASTLCRVRKSLEESGIQPDRFFERQDRSHVTVRPEIVEWTDVDEISERERQIDTGNGVESHLRRALDLYRGALLEDQFVDWADNERRRFESIRLRLLRELLRVRREAGDHDQVIALAEQFLHLDPICEEVYRELISAYQMRGEKAKSLEIYERCRATLGEGLGVAPSPETQALMSVDRMDLSTRFQPEGLQPIVEELRSILSRVQELEVAVRKAIRSR